MRRHQARAKGPEQLKASPYIRVLHWHRVPYHAETTCASVAIPVPTTARSGLRTGLPYVKAGSTLKFNPSSAADPPAAMRPEGHMRP